VATEPANLGQTPLLAARLSQLRQRLRRAVWTHALGTVLLVVCAWLVFVFVADYGLGVPRAVRFFHLAVLLALPLAVIWREGLRHLRRLPDDAGLAVLAERALERPEQVLVSAVQFQGGERPRDPLEGALVARVLERAERRAAEVDWERVLDPRLPRRRALSGAAAVATLGLAALLSPREYTGIFLQRLLGAATPWPQRTFLELELGLADGGAQLAVEGELLRARVARGSDLPVLVRAVGQVPERVRLRFDDGRVLELSAARGALFRTELPALRDSFAFGVTGGDDRDGWPRAEVEVLQPPDVTAVAITVEPPAYSGLPAQLFTDRSARALRGSLVTMVVRCEPSELTARAELLPEGRQVELERLPFPGAAPAEPLGHGLRFVAEQSVRVRFQLTDANGLENPDPGLFGVDLVEDHVPEVVVVAPGRTNVESVAGGALALRARVEDDFGLRRVLLRWRVGEDGALGGERELPQLPLVESDDPSATGPGGAPRVARVHALLELDPLLGAAAQSASAQLVLELGAEDSAEPAQWGQATPIRVRLLTVDELLRRVQDRLSAARLEAGAVAELQRERRTRTEELLDSLSDDGGLEPADARAVQSALNGQRRVDSDAEALLRSLTAVAEQVLYARLDPQGEGLLLELDRLLAPRVERSFDLEPWRELIAFRERTAVGEGGFAVHLLQIVALGVAVDETAGQAVSELSAADGARDAASARGALVRAVEAQTANLARLEDLLDRLSEWDNFQSVLALTRDILDRQKALRERARTLASEK
jgi:hypothetical protein